MKFISKIVDVGNHLMGKGATSIEIDEEVQRLKYFLNKIDLAIDVGANQGQYSKEPFIRAIKKSMSKYRK